MSPGLDDGPRNMMMSPGLDSPLPHSPADSYDIIDYISNNGEIVRGPPPPLIPYFRLHLIF